MSAYHQMGDKSWNLIDEASLAGYRGLILSPVNDGPSTAAERLKKLPNRDQLEAVLDPQFYKPSSDKGCLGQWSHFTDEVLTADIGDLGWWEERCEALVATAKDIGADTVCSPSVQPRLFSDEYFSFSVQCAERLVPLATEAGLGTMMTAIVGLDVLAEPDAPKRIASILTATAVDRIYLVFYDDIGVRVQRTDSTALAGAMKLIRALEEAGTRLLVAFSGLDMLLWKYAGASDVATGKHFNLRRYVPGRWDDRTEGGRNLPYWTDEGFLTWLREEDLKRLDKAGLIDRARALANPYTEPILKIVDGGAGEPWIWLGWRQYLHWFKTVEAAIDARHDYANELLAAADHRWGALEKSKILLADRINTGDWIRAWLNAMREASG